MSRIDNISLIYSRILDKRIVRFEELQTPYRIEQLLSFQDIMQLYNIAKSNKLSAKPKEKYKMIDSIMTNRGFRKLASGTNRVVYKFMESQSIVLKIAIDSVGLKDNPAEFKNQNILKPFVTKVFQVTPCGTVGLFERVNPITSREEFASVAMDIFDIITTHFLGKYVLADFGAKYFMNWGVRVGQFPVLLDFPYLYELDGSKLQCNAPDPNNPYGFCLGEIDYDDGFNYLICKKCGKHYLAKSLELEAKNKNINIVCTEEGDLDNMKIIIEKSNGQVVTNETTKRTSCYERPRNGKTQSNRYNNRDRYDKPKTPYMRVIVEKSSDSIPDNPIISEEKCDELKQTIATNSVEYKQEEFNTQVSLESVPKVDRVYSNSTPQDINEETPNFSASDMIDDDNDDTVNMYQAESARDLLDIEVDDANYDEDSDLTSEY